MRRRRKGSMIVALLLAATFMLHASLEILPLWTKAVESSRLAERKYRLERLNFAIERFVAVEGHAPTALETLLQGSKGPYLPRVYEDPCRTDGQWKLRRNEEGGILSIESRLPSPKLLRPPLAGGEGSQKTKVN